MTPGKRNSGKPTITIRDVAKSSGFSATTVSIVLNNAPLARYIPQTTKARIQSAAKKLGYHPNIFAKSLRSRRNHTVGVMVCDVTDPYCTLILRGIENSLYQASFLPILADAHNERPRFERYVEMLLERRVEALIIVANWLLIDINLLADLEKSDIPTVVIGREMQSKSISSIIVDDEGGAYAAVAHLYGLGHRKIAFVRGPKGLLSSKNRWRGVQRFAHDTGLELDSRLIVDLPEQLDPNLGVPDGYRATEELLKKRRTFTALMAFDDMTALGAMRATNMTMFADGSVLLQGGTTTLNTPSAFAASNAIILVEKEKRLTTTTPDASLIVRGGEVTVSSGLSPLSARNALAVAQMDPSKLFLAVGGRLVLEGGLLHGPRGSLASARIDAGDEIRISVGGASKPYSYTTSSGTGATVSGSFIMIGSGDSGFFESHNVPLGGGSFPIQFPITVNTGSFVKVLDQGLGAAVVQTGLSVFDQSLLSYIIFAANEETRASRIRRGLGEGDDLGAPACK